MKSKDPPPVAFLFPAFPVLHQTFVMWEVLALRERGIPIVLYSIKRPGAGMQQPEAAQLAREVRYLPSMFSARVWQANLRVFTRNPRRYVGVFALLIREWWRDRVIASIWRNPLASKTQGERVGLMLWGRFRSFFNRNHFTYLLKSVWLVPLAVALGAELEAEGIRRLHAHWASYPATMGLVVRWVFGIPFSFTAHAYDIYLVPRLLPVKIRMAEFVVTCAQANARALEAVAGPIARERVIVNYHGVDLKQFSPRQVLPDTDLPCIVSCGSLAFYKGHHILLRACALLGEPFRCIVIGEGAFRPYLEELARSLGISEHVTFTGALPQAKVAELYGKADLFVLASVLIKRFGKRDVIPNVLAEAMAMQVPVVATDISGISELVIDGVTGRLIPPEDPRALAAVMKELLSDEPQRRRLALGGYHMVVQHFDRSANIPALAALFEGRTPVAVQCDVDAVAAAAVGRGNGSNGAGQRVELVPCTREDEWDALVAQYPDATPFHRAAWLRWLARRFHADPKAYAVYADGQCVGVFPAVIFRRGPFRVAASPPPRAGLPYLGPIVPPELLSAACDAFNAHMRRERVSYVEIRFPSHITLLPEGFETEPRGTHLVDLRPGADTLWAKGLSSACRRAVRKATAAGVTIEEGDLAAHLDRYYDLAVEVFAKSRQAPWLRKEDYAGLAEIARVGGAIKVLFAWQDGELIGGGIFPFHGHTVYYLDGVDDARKLHLRPHNLLHWELMRWACAQGLSRYDMLGSGIEGIDRFKRGFGAVRMPCRYAFCALDPLTRLARDTYALLAPAGRAVRRLQHAAQTALRQHTGGQ